MLENLINKYVTLNNIKKVAKKEGIILEDYEEKVIYNVIKKEWMEICYKDAYKVFEKHKSEIKKETYNVIISLYEKYKPFLNKF